MGLALAGFQHEVVVERDKDAVATLRKNHRLLRIEDEASIKEQDSRLFDFRKLEDKIVLLAAGPPCQPFSLGGKHHGYLDDRDMFPEVFRAMYEIRPKAVVVENVKELARPQFSKYVDYIKLRMALPELMPLPEETWIEHRSRLANNLNGCTSGLRYSVQFHRWNAVNFGVPQKRDRVFFIAFREDFDVKWTKPLETHTSDRLLWEKWVTGEYWDRHQVARRNRFEPEPRVRSRLNGLLKSEEAPVHEPWMTVRDAISDLVPLDQGETDPNDLNHFLNPGAKTYRGHTGSTLDEPAKTLKAGDHGVPGGENTLRSPDGSVRYFTVREGACLQTLPLNYFISGTWTEQMRQIGNAVPVVLAQAVGCSLASALAIHDT